MARFGDGFDGLRAASDDLFAHLPWQAMAALGLLLIVWVCVWAFLRSSAQREKSFQYGNDYTTGTAATARLIAVTEFHATDAPGFPSADRTDVGTVESASSAAHDPDARPFHGLPPGIHPVYFWPGEVHHDFEVMV